MNKKNNILIFNPFVFQLTRGNETLALELANHFVNKGSNVCLAGIKGISETHVKLYSDVKISVLPKFRYLQSLFLWPFLFKLLLKKTDAVIIFFPDYGMASLIKLFKKTNFLLYLGYSIHQSKWQFDMMLKSEIAKKNVHLIGCSPEISHSTSDYLKVSVDTILPGFDTRRFCLDLNKRKETRTNYKVEESFLIVAAAAFKKGKNLHKVIETIALLSPKYNIKCFIAGDGEEKEALSKLVKDLNLNGIVQFIGLRNDLENFYNAADLFLHLSESEGDVTGLTAREAMSCECLTMVYPNSINGLEKWHNSIILLDTCNPEYVANEIEKILVSQDKSEFKKISKNGRNFILKNYNWDKTIMEFEALIKRVNIV